MFARIITAFVFVALVVNTATAQTIRFDTNVGNIDLVLNPTNNINLQAHVDNIMAYIDAGRYNNVVINRAVEGDNDDPSDDFILQFGGFVTNTQVMPPSFNDFSSVQSFSPVTVDFDGDGQVDFNTTDLTNTRGTVSLALAPGQPNSGTASFFANLGDNSNLLDPQGFVPFATVRDMSTVDYIMRLNQTSTNEAGAASTDIPILDDNVLVVVERVFVLEEAPMAMAALAPGSDDLGDLFDPSALNTLSVPEPPALVLAVGALMAIAVLTRRGLG